ncbi:nmrA family domain protein [Burkholderia cepacia]|nr:nmrA family domain protein [Burkholderia cepacia]
MWSEQYLLDELARDPNNMMRKYRAAFAQGRGVACDGDLLACGARLIASQDQTGG